MAQRRIGQGSLADALLPAGAGSNPRLDRIAGLIDWAPMERLLAPLRAPTGRPGYPPLALLRALFAGAVVPALRSWPRGGAGRPAVVPPVLRLRPGRRHAGRDHAVPLPRHPGRARSGSRAVRRAEPPARCPRPDAEGRHADRRDADRGRCHPTKDPEAGFTRRGQRSFFGIGSHRGDRRDGCPSRRMSRSISART